MFDIFGLFGGRKSKESTTLPSDHVYPMGILDDIMGVAESVPCVLMRFNDVLDANKLHQALVTVLSSGDWRKLTGRFQRNKEGKLHLHAPEKFTADHPAVRYVHLKFDVNIEEHPLASQLPKTTAQPSLQHSTSEFGPFCTRAGAPGELNEFLASDEPPIALQITSFQDATLVAVSWSHVLADATGFQEIVTAWCKALAGREAEIPPVLGAREDAAPGIWESKTATPETYLWESKMLTGLRFIWFVVRFVWQIIWCPKPNSRTLFLPAAFVAGLRQRAEKDLAAGTFVSDGDILCTWLSRLIVSVNRHSGPVTVLNVVDIRGRMPSVFEKGGVYIQNLTMPSLTFLDGHSLKSSPLGTIALQVRESILVQTAEEQIRALYKKAMPYLKSKGSPPVFGDPRMLLVPISNWTKAKFVATTDFNPALVRPGYQGADRSNPPGRMVYQITSQIKHNELVRNTAVIIAKDHSGNYWVTLYLAECLFPAVEEILRNAGEL